MLSLKKLKFFFFKYNSTLNTNNLYFTLPLNFLLIIKFFYNFGIISFYIISEKTVYIYLPKKLLKNLKFKSVCKKHQKIFHGAKNVTAFNWYLTSFGLMSGLDAKKLNIGGRLLYFK